MFMGRGWVQMIEAGADARERVPPGAAQRELRPPCAAKVELGPPDVALAELDYFDGDFVGAFEEELV